MVARIAFLALLLSCVTANADHHKSLAYLQSFVGVWDVKDSAGSTGTITITNGVTGQCLVIRGEFNHRSFDEVFGFHPKTKMWSIMGISNDGGRYTHRIEGLPSTGSIMKGDRWTASSSGVTSDGKDVSEKLVWEASGPNRFEVLVTEQKVGDESLPDRKLTCERRNSKEALAKAWLQYLAGTWEFELGNGTVGRVSWRASGKTPALTFSASADDFSILGVIGWRGDLNKLVETDFATESGTHGTQLRTYDQITHDYIRGLAEFSDSSGLSGSQALQYSRISENEMTLAGAASDDGGTEWTVRFKRVK